MYRRKKKTTTTTTKKRILYGEYRRAREDTGKGVKENAYAHDPLRSAYGTTPLVRTDGPRRPLHAPVGTGRTPWRDRARARHRIHSLVRDTSAAAIRASGTHAPRPIVSPPRHDPPLFFNRRTGCLRSLLTCACLSRSEFPLLLVSTTVGSSSFLNFFSPHTHFSSLARSNALASF